MRAWLVDQARRLLALVALAACLPSMVACVALPERPPLAPSSATRADADSALGRVAGASLKASGASFGESAFRIVHSGTHALDARIALIRSAERSLDVQYYHVAGDNTGRGILRELRDAAARGVRVRLLIDDLYTTGQQEALAGLAAFDRIEVRLFNPFPDRAGSLAQRFIASLGAFRQLQMRMHNKLLVADGAVAIGGGRNIADEYYWQSESDAFFDYDIAMVGAALPELSALFDRYWNSERVWPVEELAPRADPAVARARFDDWVADARLPDAPRIRVDLLGYGRIADEIRQGAMKLQRGRARVVADSPMKIDQPSNGKSAAPADLWSANTETRRIYNSLLRDAKSEVTMISPYTVPGEAGVERLRAMRERGAVTRVLTNSLASTDEPVVHTGYRRYRKAIIGTGTELYELDPVPSSDLVVDEMRGKPVLHIHVKSAIFDRRIVYLGSMNFDPRSAALNTEIAFVIESEELASDVLTLVDKLIQQGSWRVRIAADGELEWRKEGAGAAPLRVEPRASAAQRGWLHFLSWVIPESVL